MRKIFNWIDKQEVSVGSWMATFLAICTIRFFLECFSSEPQVSLVLRVLPAHFIQYALFYLASLLGIACVLWVFTRDAPSVFKMMLFGVMSIFIAPLIDLFVMAWRGNPGHTMTYIFAGTDELWQRFFHFFVSSKEADYLTFGMHIEIAFILVLIGAFTFCYRRFWLAPIAAILVAYCYTVSLGALPSLIELATHGAPLPATLTGQDFIGYFNQVFLQSGMQRILPPTEGSVMEGFSRLIGQVLYLVSFVVLLALTKFEYPRAFSAVMQNCRPERMLFYVAFLFAGFGLALAQGTSLTWLDYLAAIVLTVSWASAWMYALHCNDIADIAIDKISNKARPLAAGTLTIHEMRQIALGWLVISLIGSLILSSLTLMLNVFCLMCSYVYSMPPLRLKRVPIIASLLIALVVLATVLAGFYLISIDKASTAIPYGLMFGLILVFTLGVNVRDIKDIEGDKAQGIRTLPVLFGRRVTGALLAMSFLLVPLVIKWPLSYVIAVPAAIAGYLAAVHRPYRDKQVFVVYFAAATAALTLFFIASRMGWGLPALVI